MRRLMMWFYLSLPYLALIAVGKTGAQASWMFYLTGWITAFIFQIFFLSVNQADALIHSPLYRTTTALVPPVLIMLRQFVYGGGMIQYFIELFIMEVLLLNFAVTFAMLSKIKEDWGMALFGFLMFGSFLGLSFWGLLQNWLLLNPELSWLSLLPLLLALISTGFQQLRFLLAVARGDVLLTDASLDNPILFFVGQIVLWFGVMIWVMTWNV